MGYTNMSSQVYHVFENLHESLAGLRHCRVSWIEPLQDRVSQKQDGTSWSKNETGVCMLPCVVGNRPNSSCFLGKQETKSPLTTGSWQRTHVRKYSQIVQVGFNYFRNIFEGRLTHSFVSHSNRPYIFFPYVLVYQYIQCGNWLQRPTQIIFG